MSNELKEQAQASLQQQPANNKPAPLVKFKDTIEKYIPELQKALPKHIDAARLARICLTSVTKTPKLLECSTQSLFGCILQSAQLGLEVDNNLGHAWLIPYGSEAQLIIGYQGMIELGYRSGLIKSLNADTIYSNDEFNFEYGTKSYLKHKPAWKDRGTFTGVYAVAELATGGKVFQVLPESKILEAMAKSMSRGSRGPWKDNFDEMAIKTAFRRLFKRLPKSPEIQRALHLEGLAEQQIPQGLSISNQENGELIPNDFTEAETLE